MPNSINAQVTPVAGLISSADGSGVLNLQGSGTTRLTVDSTGAYVTKNPTQPLEIATKQYVDTTAGGQAFVKIAGDTMTGNLNIPSNSLIANFVNATGGTLQAGLTSAGNTRFLFNGTASINADTFSKLLRDSDQPSSVSSAGWQRFSSGLYIQWGEAYLPTGNGDIVYFPRAFPNGCFTVVHCDSGAIGEPSACLSTGHTTVTPNYFQAFARQLQTGNFNICNLVYVAFGY